jgi:protein-tyrosine phosphatase
MKKVMFVCLGNICRSPMAEGSFKALLQTNGLEQSIACASSGTAGYHIGKMPDARMRETAQKHGIRLTSKAQQFDARFFDEYDYIVPMDIHNQSDVLALARSEKQKAKVRLLREYVSPGQQLSVPDPYYGGLEGFEEVYQIISSACAALLEHVKKESKP